MFMGAYTVGYIVNNILPIIQTTNIMNDNKNVQRLVIINILKWNKLSLLNVLLVYD